MDMSWSGGVYKLYIDGYSYIGSTNCFRQRFREHRSRIHNDNCDDYLKPLYLFIRNNGGWDSFFHEILEEVDINITTKELWELERKYIEDQNPNLNNRMPILTEEERLEQHKIYKQRMREYNNNRLKQKMSCDCGAIFALGYKSRHRKTTKHISFVKDNKTF